MALDRVFASITSQGWDLHGRGSIDQGRHDEKVKEAIRGDLPNIVSDVSIISAEPKSKKILKIPMRSLELPTIRHKDDRDGVGTGDGSEEEGQYIGGQPGSGQGSGAGNQPGVEFYEVEFTVEEIARMVFADLGLPYLQPKKRQTVESDTITFDDVRKKRTPSNLDLNKTLIENMKRNAMEKGKAEIGGITPEDYRVRIWNQERRPENSAVAIFMRDISGSMGEFEKYMTRSFAWWSLNFLRSKYPNVETVFIVHDTVASETDEDNFFKRDDSGGTICSSANNLALDIIKKRFPPSEYNVYLSHFSDGDNYSQDDILCAARVLEMLGMDISQYAYVQIGPKDSGGLFARYQNEINNERFNAIKLLKKEDILPGLQKVFDPTKQILK